MLFNSAEFLFVFLPLALAGFQVAGAVSRTAAVVWLALISIAFYGMWRKEFVLLLGASILFNYASACVIAGFKGNEGRQKVVLTLAITGNLLALCYYKYLFPTLGFLNDAGILSRHFDAVVLPLGISFFTFTQIAYLIDLKQESAELEPFPNYILFVTFFPHLIAGPILHHSEIMPQIVKRRRFALHSEALAAGLSLFVIGLFKKVVLADNIAPYAVQVFESTAHVQLLAAWAGVLSYAMQLYFDFSGYSDMAIGLAYMFSIRFPLNFNSPYKAKSIIDFWQRWHMTLTRYLTLYLYNPMALALARRAARRGRGPRRKGGMNFSGFLQKVCFPTLTTMFIAGVWHGAGFQFIVFGLLHGFYLSVNHAWRIFGSPIRHFTAPVHRRLPWLFSAASTAIVFLAVIVGQVFFRATSTRDALHLLGGMAGLHGASIPASFALTDYKQGALLLALAAIVWLCPNSQQILAFSGLFTEQLRGAAEEPTVGRRFSLAWQPSVAWATIMAVLFVAGLLAMSRSSEFLYFQF